MSRPVGAEADAWRAAHRRLYEHLCATTKEGAQPTLEDLQPLYQAVAHGCQAGLQQEACDKVYYARIARGKEAYAVKKLGAFGSDLGAVACLFEGPWHRVSHTLIEPVQAWLLNQAAFRLRALGRLTEALEPMRAGLEYVVTQQNWENATVGASNLSELELTLGEVAAALGDAELSVTYADRSGDAFQRIGQRCTHADALHQAGRRAEAETRFREAEQMQAESQPEYPLLYGPSGFEYCDLLLAAPERAAWRLTSRSAALRAAATPNDAAAADPSDVWFEADAAAGHRPALLAECRAVSQRAAQTLKWVTDAELGLLDIALDHLTLGRAALYEFILGGRGSTRAPTSRANGKDGAGVEAGPPDTALRELDAAVAGLRHAGTTHHVPRALLTRAWLRFLTSSTSSGQEAHASAQEDLDEAWEIAERGPMPLFIADIHLSRARLFGARNGELGAGNEELEYPWESVETDLAEAERLIRKHGYHRRDEELADAKQALLGR